jgi:hypothetical protein
MTSIETLYTNASFNELSFPLVTHMVNSDAWIDSYGILKSGQGSEHSLDRLDKPTND